MKFLKGIVAGLFGLVVGSAQALTIVNTGPGRYSGGFNLDFQDQWLAQQFTIDQTYRITDAQGWMGANIPGSVTVALYTDGPIGPDDELFTAEFFVEGSVNDWHGVSGLSWDLNAGTYWAAFEVRPGQTMRGYMGGEPTYQVGWAAYSRPEGGWTEMNNPLGIRIYGVPEPSTYALLLTALGLLVLTAKRQRQKLHT